MAFRLFQKHPKEVPTEAPLLARVTVIPDAFYGGANPVVYADQTSTPADRPSVTPKMIPVGQGVQPLPHEPIVARRADIKATMDIEEKKPAEQVSRNESEMLDIPKEGKSRAVFMWVGVGLTLIILGGISYWYVTRSVQPLNEPVAPTPLSAEPLPTPPTPVAVLEPMPVVTSTPTTTVTEGPILTGSSPLSLPALSLLPDDADIDNDGLTDTEEDVLQTDSGTWDTDGDGYYDGQEVMNLYNPTGFAPVKIIESGRVREYAHPMHGWNIYYPTPWDVGVVDDTSSHILFSAVTGDYIEVIESEKLPGETFELWFARVAQNQRFSDILKKTNRFMIPFYVRQDGLVGYVEDTNRVYVVAYHQGSASVVLYRHVMDMMLQSFRTAQTAISTPDQPRIPVTASGT